MKLNFKIGKIVGKTVMISFITFLAILFFFQGAGEAIDLLNLAWYWKILIAIALIYVGGKGFARLIKK